MEQPQHSNFHSLRPLTAPTPEFFNSNIPCEHASLLLQAKLKYKRPRSPDNLRLWSPQQRTTTPPTSSLLSDSLLLSLSRHEGEEILLSSPDNRIQPSSSISSSTFPNTQHHSTMFDVSESTSSTPRSVRSKSLHYSSQAQRYTQAATSSRKGGKAKLVREKNTELAQKFQLLEPLPATTQMRPQTVGFIGLNRNQHRSGGGRHDRAALKIELEELHRQVRTLQGKEVHGAHGGSGSGSGSGSTNDINKMIAERAQKRQDAAPTRQAGDLRGMSGRNRVDHKLHRFRDPNQLAALLTSLGMKSAYKSVKKGNGDDGHDGHDGDGDDQARPPTLKDLAVVRTPRTMMLELKEWGQKINNRQALVKLKRAAIIKAELQRVYDVGSSFKLARKKKAADDRLSERKVARGWNKMMWRWIACKHFHACLQRGKEKRAAETRSQLAQIIIASAYRRKQAVTELKARRRADYMLKLHLKRKVHAWKKRRRRGDADVLFKWLSATQNFAKQVLGYNMLRRSAVQIQTAWRNFQTSKTELIKKLSSAMYDVAHADHGYQQMRRKTLQKIPALDSMPPFDIRYELLSNVLRPLRRQWLDTAMPKYKLARKTFLAKKERYERQKKNEEKENRGKRKKRKELDLGSLLIAPMCPRFRVHVPDSVLLLTWKSTTTLAKQPFKWKKMKKDIQVWLAGKKSTKFHKQAPSRRRVSEVLVVKKESVLSGVGEVGVEGEEEEEEKEVA